MLSTSVAGLDSHLHDIHPVAPLCSQVEGQTKAPFLGPLPSFEPPGQVGKVGEPVQSKTDLQPLGDSQPFEPEQSGKSPMQSLTKLPAFTESSRKSGDLLLWDKEAEAKHLKKSAHKPTRHLNCAAPKEKPLYIQRVAKLVAQELLTHVRLNIDKPQSTSPFRIQNHRGRHGVRSVTGGSSR